MGAALLSSARRALVPPKEADGAGAGGLSTRWHGLAREMRTYRFEAGRLPNSPKIASINWCLRAKVD